MDFARQGFVEVAAVEKAGQRIANRLLMQLLGALAYLFLKAPVECAQILRHRIAPAVGTRQHQATGHQHPP